MNRDSDYENYDYREFWQDDKRIYEDSAERLALRKFFKPVEMRDRTLVDLGCGYGRLFNEYRNFRNIVLVDYSLSNLKNAREIVSNFLKHDKKELGNIFFVAADVNSLPFKDSLIDLALTIRVIHHISSPEKFFTEVRRILRNDSLFLLEFANKRNLKNILRFFTGRIKKSPFSSEVFHVGETISNYHPRYIKSLLEKNGFRVIKQISVSNFRLGFLKRHIRLGILIFLEKLYQGLFSWTGTGPSIFLKTISSKQNNKKRTGINSGTVLRKNGIASDTTPALFICPYCKSEDLEYSKVSIICKKCNRVFSIVEGIYDFRP